MQFLFYTKIPMKINEAMLKFLNFAELLERKAESTLVQYRTATSRFCWFLEQKYGEIPELSTVELEDIMEYSAYLDNLEVLRGYSKKKVENWTIIPKPPLSLQLELFLNDAKPVNLNVLNMILFHLLSKKETRFATWLVRKF